MTGTRSTLAALVVLLAVSGASAQTGGILVKVTDKQGPLPGATVTISHELGYVKETAANTDVKGIVEFPVLRPTGSSGQGYTIVVVMHGFAKQRIGNVKVRAGKVERLPIELSGEYNERLEVIGRPEVVDFDDPSQKTQFDAEFMQDLPIPGRTYQNLLTLAPGVQDADGDGNPNVHGSRDRDFKMEVSGVANVDPLTGQQMSQVNPNSIEEMEVITAGAGVEFSRAQGGFGRILQKQGSNDFEGVFDLYWRSSLFDGDGAGDFSNVPDPGFDTFQPGIQVSGPIIEDKLWYRLSHMIIDSETPTNVTNGIVVVEDRWGIHSDRITWQASPRNKLTFDFQADPRTINNFGVNSSTPESASLRVDQGSKTYTLSWTAPLSPKILIDSKVSWQDLNNGIAPSVVGAKNDCLIGSAFLEDAQCFNIDTGETSGSFPIEVDDHRQRLTVRSDATVFGGRFLGMTHQFKFGMIVENERYFRDQTQRPSVSFFVFNPINDPAGGDLEGDPLAVVVGDFPVPERTEVRATGVTWGFYAEDQIKPLQNLTVTLGVRVDREEVDSSGKGLFFPEDEFAEYRQLLEGGISPQRALQRPFTAFESLDDFYRQLSAQIGIPFSTLKSRQTSAALASQFWDTARRNDNIRISNTNVAPFFSVAWDPFANGKTKLAATARRYYDKVFLFLPLLELNASSAFVAFNANRIAGQWRVAEGPAGLRSSVSPAVNVETLDRNLRTPRQDEWTLSFEREIAAETTIAVSYVNRKFRGQYQDSDLNHVPGDFGRCRLATVLNPSTIVPVLEGEPDYDPVIAPGDGIIDDCAGEIEIPPDLDSTDDPFSQETRVERPDGIPDLYTLNPGWGQVLRVGNINDIDYEAFVLELVRRQYRSWELRANYTWAEAIGDGEDFRQLLGNDPTLEDNERGYQSYDQRHVVAVSATSATPWGFRLGGAIKWESGVPYSILRRELSFDATPPEFGNIGAAGTARSRTTYVTGQRNDQRNASFWDFSTRLSKELTFGRGLNMQLSVEVFNLLNDGTYQIYSDITQSGQQINGNNGARRRFGRRWQLGLKMAF